MGLSAVAGVICQDDRRGFRLILLDRPKTRNALDAEVVTELRTGLKEAPGSVVVLGSTDPTVFSSGADIRIPDGERASVSDSLYSLYREMRQSPRLVVAAASGPAVGGGAQLMIAADIRIMSPTASLRFLGLDRGLVVGAWGLPALVGRGRALDLCLSMRTVGADEATAIGLADRLVDDPLEAAMEYAVSVASLDPLVVAAAKRIVGVASIDDALSAERVQNSGWSGEVPTS